MAREVLHRTLTVRSALGPANFGEANNGPGSFEALLRVIHAAYTTIPERRVELKGQIIEARNVDSTTAGRTMLHLVSYTPDEQIYGVPRARNVASAELELLEAPDNIEFLDGQLMALIDRNEVVLCKDGLGEAGLVAYAMGLARKNRMDTAPLAFQLMKRVDIDKLEMIRSDGIESVSMNAVAHQASIDHVERHNVRERIIGGALDELRAILGIEPHAAADVENVKVEVLFSFDKRGGTVLDQRELVQLAELAVAEEEGFSIKTLKGRTLRAEDVVLSKPVSLTAFGKSVHHADAWTALAEFYDELSTVRPHHG